MGHLQHAGAPRPGSASNALAGDRLRRFLDAFRVEIHYDVRTGRAVFRVEIGGEMIDQLTQQISRAEVERSVSARARLRDVAKEEGGEGAALIKGSSVGLCPRQGTQSIPQVVSRANEAVSPSKRVSHSVRLDLA